MVAGGRAGQEVDGVFIVKVVNLEPAVWRRQVPLQCVDENAFPVVVHLHQCRSMLKAHFG